MQHRINVRQKVWVNPKDHSAYRMVKIGTIVADNQIMSAAICKALENVDGIETQTFVRVHSHSVLTRFVDIPDAQTADELIQDIRAAFDL